MIKHKSVLTKETIELIDFKKGVIIVDTTLGLGGHSKEIIKHIKKGKLICIDYDIDYTKKFEDYLKENGFHKEKESYKKNGVEIFVKNSNFSRLSEILSEVKIPKADTVIFDLGWSSDQLISVEGLSYQNEDSVLDMRLDKSLEVKANDLLNYFSKKELEKMFRNYGEIKDSKILAKKVIEKRKFKPFFKVKDLLNILIKKDLKYISQVFQSLRIAVNQEYPNISEALLKTQQLIKKGGVIIIITFQSLEEKIVKEFIKNNRENFDYKNLDIRPTVSELKDNISARSAKLIYFRKK